MKIVIFFLFSLILWQPVWAQRADYRTARKFLEQKFYSTRVNPVFLKNSDRFWFSYKTGRGIEYWLVDPGRGKKSRLFDNHTLAAGLSERTRKVLDEHNLLIPELDFSEDSKKVCFNFDHYRVTYDVERQKLISFDSLPGLSPVVNPLGQYSPDSSRILYARQHNLYIREVKSGKEICLTQDGEPYYSYARNEQEHSLGEVPSIAHWFKDSRTIWVSRIDRRRVGSLALLNAIAAPRPQVLTYKYVLPGDQEVPQFQVSVFHLEADSARRVEMQSAKWKDQTMDVVYTSDKDPDHIYLMRKNRFCNELELCLGNTQTGEVNVLISEKSYPYLNDQLFQFAILNDGEDILWWSDRTGYGHFYRYDGKGNLKNAVTSGDWTAGKVLKIDTLNRILYLQGLGRHADRNPYYAHLYTACLDREEVRELTPEDAHHQTFISPQNGYLIDNYSRVDLEPRSVLRDRKGRFIMELARPDLSRLYAFGWKMPERFTVKAKDGVTDLYGVMWKPYDFDSTRTYPVISHVYPGPQEEIFPLDFDQSNSFDAPMAQLGFIVVNFGHRGGSPLRSKSYHTFGYGNLRDYPLADDKYGLEQLAERYSFIDMDRVGIWGHSGGGMMAVAALCTYPDFYKAAVSSAGNHDNRIYNKWWGETHQGIRETQQVIQKDGFSAKETRFTFQVATNMELVNRLKGHLMLAVGDMDDNVHPASTIRLADALIKTGKNFDFVLLPGQGHQYQGPGGAYFQYRMWMHFARYLLGDSSADFLTDLNQIF